MPDEPDWTTKLNDLAEAMDAAKQVIEMTVGYRTQCLDEHFSAEAAEQMAVTFHTAIWMGTLAQAAAPDA